METKPNQTEMRGSLRVVLFDLDGTLVDSYDAITRSVNFVREKRGLEPLSQPDVRRAVGKGVAHLLDQLVPAGDARENIAWFVEHHPNVLLEGTRPLPFADETLQTLTQAGYRLGVCSNKPLALTRRLLHLLNLEEYFVEVLGPELVEHPKPAPDMLQLAMHKLQVSPEQTLYVGDMAIDVATARAAGLAVWVVPTGSDTVQTLRQAEPDRLLESLEDVTRWIANSTHPDEP